MPGRRACSFALLTMAATSVARAGSYTSSVLYPLSVPVGFSNPFPTDTSQAAAAGQVVGSAVGSDAMDHAFVWSPGSPSGIDLSAGFSSAVVKSYALGANGSQQVGYTEGSAGAYSDQAMLWAGGTVVNLNPGLLSGISASEANGVFAGQQVGYGSGSGTSNYSHAMLWTGTANSAVDLNPGALGFISSTALETDGTRQVGDGFTAGTGISFQALLWNGSAGSAVNLNPTALGITMSYAYGISGNQQVGRGSGIGTGGGSHALLWTGTAASAVDLNPTNLTSIAISQANGTNGNQQVGFGSGSGTSNQIHALLWSGTAASAVDLQTLLPAAGSWISSYASTIDNSGNVYGIAHGTLNNISGYFGVEWSPNSNVTDIGSGNLDLSGASLATIVSQIQQGYSGGTWTGTSGITSSAAANDSTHLTAVGVIQNNESGMAIYSGSNPFEGKSPGDSDVLVKYTYYGDTNLDGKVDGSDYSRMDVAVLANQSSLGSATGWFNGDFNYDGVINGSDYTLIDNAFNSQGAAITASVAGESAVPEPVRMGVVAMMVLGLLGRRRVSRNTRR